MHNVMNERGNLNGAAVTALAHLEIGWRWTEPGESIPYAMTFLSRRRPTRHEVGDYVRSRPDPGDWNVSLA